MRVLFTSMLAVKDADFVVRLDAYKLSRRAKMKETEVIEGLRILSSPDTKRITPQPYDGRRIKEVADGWFILNGEKYRQMISEEMKKARNRKSQAAWRERQKGKPLPGSLEYEKAHGDGASEEQLSEIVTKHLPQTGGSDV